MKTSYILSGIALILLSGCTSMVESPTWVNEKRVEVQSDHFTDTFETSTLKDAGMVHAIANTFHRYGNGEMAIVVSYDPRSSVNTEKQAAAALSTFNAGLSREGISRTQSTLSAAVGTGDTSTTLISFPALSARPPEGCTMMPGYDRVSDEIQSDDGAKPNYRFGCSIESLMARQVARPSDLMGRQGFETKSDGARAEKVITSRGYYSDTSNSDLGGETASGK